MTHGTPDFQPGPDFPTDDGQRPARSGDVTVQELTWALVDDQIESGEFQLLESMLLSDDAARREYLDCVQLHCDLTAHYAKPAGAIAAGTSPVLGFLGGEFPPQDAAAQQS